MGQTLISVENVSKKFCRSLKRSLWYGMQDLGSELRGRSHGGNGSLRKDEFWAVKDVSFELKRGECLGLIGRNGAGKTTLLRLLNGLIKPDRGRIEVHGRVGALIALGAGFNPILTGRENIYVNASILGIRGREIDEKFDEIVEFADIGDFIDAPVQSYSSGMQVRLGFAVATALEPDVLILDEVLAVGDAAFRTKCFNRIHQMLQSAAVVFVSHNMAQITRISDQLLHMGGGRALAYGYDLGDIIAQYHESMEPADIEVSQGTGEAVLLDCHIEDKNGNKTSKIAYGSEFTIVLKLQLAQDIQEESLRILIAVADQEECNAAQISHELTSGASREPIIRLRFRGVFINAGKYSLTVGLLIDRRGRLGYVARNICSFVVINGKSAYAPISLQPTSVVVVDQ